MTERLRHNTPEMGKRRASRATYFPFNNLDRKSVGKASESRALSLLEQLVDEGIFVRVRRASKDQNLRRATDFFGVVASGTEEVHIPFQIKSSFYAAENYLNESKRGMPNRNAVVIVVNNGRPDKLILGTIKNEVIRFLRTKTNSSEIGFSSS